MARYNYDRLSAQDNSFLLLETSKVHMHVASTLVFEAASLRAEGGGIDVERIRRATEAYLHRIPRYRQKLHFIPLEDHAVWVDDRHFSLDYHIRHTALPRPGSDEQLKNLASRIMAQPLDRTRPLWETWVVEGLEGDRFALITKLHHCMIDGSSGVDLAQIMMTTTPQTEIPEVPQYIPRPAPTRSELWVDELKRRASLPLELARGIRRFASEAEDLREEVGVRLRVLGSMLGMATSASETPMNGPVGPHRKFDWLELSLADVKAVRRALDCSVNDVVLTVVTSAVREFLQRRGVDPARLDFRVSAPVSMRGEAERGEMGNRVSSWILQLPLDEEDPLRQLERIHETTVELKKSRQALGVEMMMKVAEWTPASLLSLGARATSGPINTIVTNVPGPQFPLYMQGAKLLAIYPQVPLLENLGLGIALMSYNGRICWGLNADPSMLPDVAVFRDLVARAFARVAESAGVALAEAIETPTLTIPAGVAADAEAPKKTRKSRPRAAGSGKSKPSEEDSKQAPGAPSSERAPAGA